MYSYDYDSREINLESESAAGRRKASNIKDMIRKVEQEIKNSETSINQFQQELQQQQSDRTQGGFSDRSTNQHTVQHKHSKESVPLTFRDISRELARRDEEIINSLVACLKEQIAPQIKKQVLQEIKQDLMQPKKQIQEVRNVTSLRDQLHDLRQSFDRQKQKFTKPSGNSLEERMLCLEAHQDELRQILEDIRPVLEKILPQIFQKYESTQQEAQALQQKAQERLDHLELDFQKLKCQYDNFNSSYAEDKMKLAELQIPLLDGILANTRSTGLTHSTRQFHSKDLTKQQQNQLLNTQEIKQKTNSILNTGQSDMEIKQLSSSFFENNNNNTLRVPIFDFDNLDSCVKYNNNSDDKDRINMSPSFQDQTNRNSIVNNNRQSLPNHFVDDFNNQKINRQLFSSVPQISQNDSLSAQLNCSYQKHLDFSTISPSQNNHKLEGNMLQQMNMINSTQYEFPYASEGDKDRFQQREQSIMHSAEINYVRKGIPQLFPIVNSTYFNPQKSESRSQELQSIQGSFYDDDPVLLDGLQ